MRKILIISFILFAFIGNANDTLHSLHSETHLEIDSVINDTIILSNTNKPQNIYDERLRYLNANTPMDLSYNDKVQPFIDSYLGRNKGLVARMKGIKELYFPMFEAKLDKYELPLEFKYLAIVESALNPKAKSSSGATGLWQFMYLTGKQYGLEVSSYIDERQDPYKATESACVYFTKLYDMFGDWNLVLAACNGGPGYIQRKINTVGSYNFWDLYPHLRRETRNYIPTFIAVNYVMNYAEEHAIYTQEPDIIVLETDTLTLRQQVDLKTLVQMLCINKETINYLNPAYKKEIFPNGSVLILPTYAINDFLDNEQANYAFVDAVDKKEILIAEERIIYRVQQGDYLGRIAKEHNVHLFEIKEWNNLKSFNLNVGDKLVIYVKKNQNYIKSKVPSVNNEYIVQKGDTLWGIAQKHNGLSVWKIKSLNNLESDNLKPGTKILLPKT